MKNELRANLELGVQIVMALAVIVLVGVLVKEHIFSPSNRLAKGEQISVGEKLNITNVDWQHNQKSLIFFLKKGCVYCDSSAPLYRQLITDASSKDAKILAILPDSVEEARGYLESLQLPISEVQTGSLSSYKIRGTPTVLFVDRNGIVKNVWFGAMPEREKEVRSQLQKLLEDDN